MESCCALSTALRSVPALNPRWERVGAPVPRPLSKGCSSFPARSLLPWRARRCVEASASAPGTVQVDLSTFGRRQLVLTSIAAAAVTSAPGSAVAAEFVVKEDANDGYRFLYPFGWQEVTVRGSDVVYRDVIEPLESVGVSLTSTSFQDITQLGPPEKVAQALVSKVLTAPTQESQVISAEQRVKDGKTFYTVEYTAKAKTYTRHGLATVGINRGRFYTITTGASEKRWSKMKDTLRTVAESFTLLF